jgi:hypothetical protein
MAITRKAKPGPAAAVDAEAFIAGAPDARRADPVEPAPYEKGIAKGNKRQISLTIAPELLRRVDEVARQTGQGRASIINLAIYRALEGDIFKS